MRTHHLEAILLFLENAFVEGETRIPIGEDSYMPYALIREARGEIERMDSMIDSLYSRRYNTCIRCWDVYENNGGSVCNECLKKDRKMS